MRPSGRTAVASMVSSAAPEIARWPRWMTCQSVMHPSTAEYWHIGAMTIRFASSRWPTRSGVNNALMRDLLTDGLQHENGRRLLSREVRRDHPSTGAARLRRNKEGEASDDEPT